jgi:hypothetical protein
MKAMGRYEVTGRRAFKGFEPGSVFDADLDVNMERRAVARGSIRLLERLVADLPPGSYRLPAGWPTTQGKEGLADG